MEIIEEKKDYKIQYEIYTHSWLSHNVCVVKWNFMAVKQSLTLLVWYRPGTERYGIVGIFFFYEELDDSTLNAWWKNKKQGERDDNWKTTSLYVWHDELWSHHMYYQHTLTKIRQLGTSLAFHAGTDEDELHHMHRFMGHLDTHAGHIPTWYICYDEFKTAIYDKTESRIHMYDSLDESLMMTHLMRVWWWSQYRIPVHNACMKSYMFFYGSTSVHSYRIKMPSSTGRKNVDDFPHRFEMSGLC